MSQDKAPEWAYEEARNMRVSLDAIALALSQAYERGQESQWQDISTVPKDGRWVMLYCPFDDRDEIRICRWVADHMLSRRHGSFGPFVWSTYDSMPNLGVIAEMVPTHWQPIPAPPAIRSLPIEQEAGE